MADIQTTGPYLYSDPAIDRDIDYLQYLTNYFKRNPKWRQLFTAIGQLVENINQPAINELAKLRDPANPDTDFLMLNTRNMGFNIPNTSFEGNEAFRTMDTLGVFYITRNASFSFINYLSFIKNTLLEPMPLWANSPTSTIDDLVYQSQIPSVYYYPDSASLNAAGSGYAVNDTITLTNIGVITVTGVSSGAITSFTFTPVTTESATDIAGTYTQASTSGSGTGASFKVTSKTGPVTDYFPTVYYDVQYTINDFIVDETVIQEFIIALQPAHLVFRHFNAVYAATATIATKPISQIFSYIGTASINSPIPSS